MTDEYPTTDSPCPCGRPATYGACCGRLHAGTALALTAEELMRSRYSAYVVRDEAYLRHSWDPATCPQRLRLSGERWTRLDVLSTSRGGALDADGTVEFVAHFELNGRADSLHETSVFARRDGRWVYVGDLTR